MGIYKDLLSKGKEAIDAIQLPFKVKKEEKNLEMKLIELEQQIANDNLTIEQEKSSNPVNWEKLTDAIDKKALNERKLKQLQDLKVEMFG